MTTTFDAFIGDPEAQKTCLELATRLGNEIMVVVGKLADTDHNEEWFKRQGWEDQDYMFECYIEDSLRIEEPSETFFKDQWILYWTRIKDDLVRKHKRARSDLIRLTPGIIPQYKDQLDIEKMKEVAKAYPVKDILDAFGAVCATQFSNGLTYLCPLHSESTASFRIFPDNHVHCFGCDFNSDSIGLYMKLHDKTFIEALKEMNV